MARYKEYSYEQGVMIPVDFSSQILPGTMEYTINWMVDNRIDLSGISRRYSNDNTGAPAYDPAILLKIILLAYSRGIVSSRMIMKACRENIVFRALSADSMPDFTTIASFIREMKDEVKTIFTGVPAVFSGKLFREDKKVPENSGIKSAERTKLKDKQNISKPPDIPSPRIENRILKFFCTPGNKNKI